MGIADERAIVQGLKDRGVSERKACLHLGLSRGSIRYLESPEDPENEQLRAEIRKIARRYRRFGSPRVHRMLGRAGFTINHKRTERLYQKEGLALPRKKSRRRRSPSGWARPCQAAGPNEVWGYDFMFKRSEYGDRIKLLTVVDEWTKEALAIVAERRMTGEGVRRALERIMSERGAPRFTRSDNGPEFICERLHGWLLSQGTTPLHAEPASPWQNGFTESFNGKFRDECLNQEIFFSRAEAQVICDLWRKHYNEERPHSSLGYKTPREAREKALPN